MYKSTFLLLLLLLLVSCSKDAITDKMIGDYRATITCSAPSVTTNTFDDCTVASLSGDRISIQLGIVLTPIFADVSEDDSITTEAWAGNLPGGVPVVLDSGTGQFSIDTLMGTSDPIKTMLIFFDDSDGNENACSLQLTEKL